MGLDDQCPAIARNRFVELTVGLISLAEIRMTCGILWLELKRASDQTNGQFVAAHLVGEDSKVVERVDMIRLPCENLPVECLGFLQSPGTLHLLG